MKFGFEPVCDQLHLLEPSATNEQTDRLHNLVCKLTIGHIYVRSTVMQPNNTNTSDNVYGVVIMARHYESSPGSFHE